MMLVRMRYLIPLVCAVAVGGCTTSVVTADSPGYKALASGDYATAENDFKQQQAQNPHDPYLEVDLAAAYQQLGRLDLAETLDRQAMIDGKGVYPGATTDPHDQGKTVAEIACENIGRAHNTSGC